MSFSTSAFARCLARHARRYSTKPLETRTDARRVIFSGIQPTGILHVSSRNPISVLVSCSRDTFQLGNYLGAISNWVKLQNEARPDDDILFTIVGWHALTLPQNPKELSVSRRDMLATLLAFGIDPKRSVLFYQEDVSHPDNLLKDPSETSTRTSAMSNSHGYSTV